MAGAAALDTLVVAPAGNDGPAGPAYGSVGGPGGAPEALTAGAEDGRAALATVRVHMRRGLQVIVDRELPLAGAVIPQQPITVDLVAPRRPDAKLPPEQRAFAGFFDSQGFSLVAGRAALVAPGLDPQQAQRDAALAGAAAIVLEGVAPAGALGLDEQVSVPVVGLPVGAARAARQALAEGATVTVSIGAPSAVPNVSAHQVAPFSSRGLAFGGSAKPELALPGLALATSEPGRNEDGTARYATVNGTSAAAATLAGAAALLAQARPGLDARALRGALVGTARLPEGTGLTEAEGGRLDLPRAAAVELAAEPATVSFGAMAEEGARAVRTLTVRNVSTRRLAVVVSARVPGVSGIAIDVEPRRLSLPRGTSGTVRLTARAGFVSRGLGLAEGTIRVRSGSQPISVPWTVAFPPPPLRLLSAVELSTDRFRASDIRPAVLTLRAGWIDVREGVPQVQPVETLEVQLWHKRRQVGTLARLRNVLPGSYAFGITGRGPFGGRLPAGAYRLRVLAIAPGGDLRTARELPIRVL